jgi:hypothetical protein
MQPPIHVTGVANADWTIFVVGTFICLYWLRALRLAREGARVFLRNLTKAALFFGFVIFILSAERTKTNLQPRQEQFAAGIVALFFFVRLQSQKRSRHIPKATRRAVIARDLKGEKFDSKRHHVDHVWPYSKGGSHTTDNLRVIGKKKNLRKGAKRPRMGEMW